MPSVGIELDGRDVVFVVRLENNGLSTGPRRSGVRLGWMVRDRAGHVVVGFSAGAAADCRIGQATDTVSLEWVGQVALLPRGVATLQAQGVSSALWCGLGGRRRP